MRFLYLKSAGLSALLLLSFCVACGSGSKSSTGSSTPASATVAVVISPGSASLLSNATTPFTASVAGSANTAVTWSVVEPGGGSIDPTGLYKAPANAGTYHVAATSQADATKSARAAIAVSAPAPIFSSTAPTAASEGAPYSYAIQAADPAGTALTLALTAAPTGAVLAGNTITWTPTAAQSRTANSFTVAANSAAGGTASQSWTISPTGTVSGSCIDTYWVATGSYPLANDLTSTTFAALIPQPDGSLLTLPGAGLSNGTFTIPNVPAGYYWLQISGYNGNVTQLALANFWTPSSTFDCGSDSTGRQPSKTSFTATINWDLTNLTPWSIGADDVEIWVPNSPTLFDAPVGYPSANGATTLVASEQLSSNRTIDPTQGDVAYVLQESFATVSNATIWDVISTAAVPSTFSAVNQGDIATATAALVPVSANQSIEMNVDFPAYAKAAISANPTFTPLSYAGIAQIQPFVADRAVNNSMLLVEFSANDQNAPGSSNLIPSTVQDLGSRNLGTQLPSTWPTIYYFGETGSVAAGSGLTISASVGHQGTTMPTASQPDEPAMTPVQNPTINGASFQSPASNYSGPLTLSWSAPSGLAPMGYAVELYSIASGSAIPLADFFTAQTSITFPSQSLPSGSYAFKVEAVANALANIESAPFHYALTQAWADAVSQPIAYTGSAATSPFIPAHATAARSAAAKSLHPLYRSPHLPH